MSASNINRVILTGNLTRDPELRTTPSGMAVCGLRIATNTRRKDNASGDWLDRPNYFDVTVWGAQGENCATYLSKGRPVAVDGRLEWREWDDTNGNKRQAVDIIADSVQFLGSNENGNGQPEQHQARFDETPPPAAPSPMPDVAVPLPSQATTAELPPPGKTPATEENIKTFCICPAGGQPRDDCPIVRHGIPFVRLGVPNLEARKRNLFVGDVPPPGEGMA